VEHAQELARPFPWRAATVVAVGVALLELVGLIVVGALLLARPMHRPHATKPAVSDTAAGVPAIHRRAVPSHPLRARSQSRVIVLNANGVQGAAHTEAARLQSLGYPIGATANAARHDYAQSMVMYVPGWGKEARRLAREAGIRIVAPVDGLKPSALKGSRLVVLLGS
jgi:LytR cell envelope-related transcriptional attenuator